MKHELRLDHPDRETWTGACSCGRWRSRFTLEDVPIDATGDLQTAAQEELGRRHDVHAAAERRDLP